MIKKLLKALALCLLVLAVLSAGGLFALYNLYPPAKLKQMAKDYVATHFQREVDFEDISFTWIGFTLHNFALSENTSFTDGSFIKANRLTAHVAVKPLLKKRIEISTVEADGLQVNITVLKDGSFNFDTLLSAQSTPQIPDESVPADDTPNTPLVLTADKISLTDCDIVYTNEQTGLRLALNDINLEINHFDLDEPFETVISFTTDISGTGQPDMTLPVTLRFQTNLANLHMPAATATLTEASARYKTVRLALQGNIQNFENPDVNLTGTLTGIDNRVLSEFAPDLPTFTLPAIGLTFRVAADLQHSTARITEAKMAIQNSALSVGGNLNWGSATPTYTLAGNLAVQLDQVVQMTDTLNDFNPAGTIKGTFKATEKKDFTDVSGTVSLHNVSLLYPPFTLTQTNGTIQLASLDAITVAPLSGQLNGENFTASFTYKNVQDVITMLLDLHLDKLVLAEFPSSSAAPEEKTATSAGQPAQPTAAPTRMNIQAHVTVDGIKIPYVESQGLVLNADLTDVTDTLSQANGTLTFTLQPGKITNLDDFIKESKVAKILLLPLTIVKKAAAFLKIDLFPQDKDGNGTTVAFTQGEGSYLFTNGEMNIQKTQFNSTVTHISATGTANFKTQALAMKATATLLTQAAPLAFTITGTLSEPKAKLNVVSTVTSVVGGILNGTAVKSAANESVGITKTTAQTAANTVKDTVTTAADVVKGIGSLFKKKKEPEK